jgi:ParB-like chromosome segregation protein Spo0J
MKKNMQILARTLKLNIKDLRNNVGQLKDKGVPANPRRIDKVAYNKLKTSLFEKDLNEIKELLVIPHNDTYVVLSGNMRLKAYKELDYMHIKCKVIDPNVDKQTLQKIIIIENTNYGSWDDDILGNEWEPELLDAWGYDLPDLNMSVLQDHEGLNENTEKLKNKFVLKVSGKNQDEIMSLHNELQDRGFELELRNE